MGDVLGDRIARGQLKDDGGKPGAPCVDKASCRRRVDKHVKGGEIQRRVAPAVGTFDAAPAEGGAHLRAARVYAKTRTKRHEQTA